MPNIKHPKVSVILPTLDRSALLQRSVASILAQSFSDFELIVVDDGSTEDISAALASYADHRLQIIRHAECRGVSAARNSGLAVARGTYVAFQDSDDEWLPDKLAHQVIALDRAPQNVAIVICGMTRLRLDGNTWSFPEPRLLADYARDSFRAVRHHAVAFTQTWLVRRSVLKVVGGFDERLRLWEDWSLLLRISATFQVVVSPKPLVLSHVTANSLSSNLAERIQALSIIQKDERIKTDPLFASRLHYLTARYLLLSGARRQAASSVIMALKIRPMDAKAWQLSALLFTPQWFALKALT